jgi:M6 family metalloprotease-like protein
VVSQAFAGQRFVFHQPDDSEIELVGWGTQFEAVFETPDGYTVVINPASGFYEYAELSDDTTTLEPSGTVVTADSSFEGHPKHLRTTRAAAAARAEAAHAADGTERRWERRRQERLTTIAAADSPAAAAPAPAVPSGDVAGLCVLIRFPDVAETITRQQVDDFCNQPGYTGFSNNGSVHDYFLHASDGRLRYTNVVTAYYTAANNRAHYTDPAIPFGQRARELIVEALTDLSNSGFDFSSLTADSAGFVYALNVFYAGPTVNNWSQGLWPHAWGLAQPFDIGGGRRLNDYQITSMGAQLTLRTFCHENGHMVCDFPDLYDYQSDSRGVGNFCLMCFGGDDRNPVEINAALKYEAGWAPNPPAIQPSATYTLAAAGNDFLIHRRSAQEYFVLENRHRSGRDAAIPDSGLAIWHYEVAGNNSNQQRTPTMHYLVSLEQADGRFDLESNVGFGDSDDLYHDGGVTAFNATTTPDSKWWDGTASGLGITSVSAAGATITVSTAVGLSLVIPNFGYDAGGWRVDMHPRVLADTTADGRADVVGFGNAGVYVSRAQANGTFTAPQLVVANYGYNAGGWRVDRHPRFAADTTGEGRADIVGFGYDGVYVSRAQANGTFTAPQLVVANFGYNAGGWRVDRHPRFLADTTGDGRADIVGFGDAGVYVSRAQANGTFTAPQLVVANFGYNAGGWRVDRHPRFLADTTADGRADIVGFGYDGVYLLRS